MPTLETRSTTNILCSKLTQVFAGLDYFAEPADVWSCGIVLVALLAGGQCCTAWSVEAAMPVLNRQMCGRVVLCWWPCLLEVSVVQHGLLKLPCLY